MEEWIEKNNGKTLVIQTCVFLTISYYLYQKNEKSNEEIKNLNKIIERLTGELQKTNKNLQILQSNIPKYIKNTVNEELSMISAGEISYDTSNTYTNHNNHNKNYQKKHITDNDNNLINILNNN